MLNIYILTRLYYYIWSVNYLYLKKIIVLTAVLNQLIYSTPCTFGSKPVSRRFRWLLTRRCAPKFKVHPRQNDPKLLFYLWEKFQVVTPIFPNHKKMKAFCWSANGLQLLCCSNYCYFLIVNRCFYLSPITTLSKSITKGPFQKAKKP